MIDLGKRDPIAGDAMAALAHGSQVSTFQTAALLGRDGWYGQHRTQHGQGQRALSIHREPCLKKGWNHNAPDYTELLQRPPRCGSTSAPP
jgi:hypothetical protein